MDKEALRKKVDEILVGDDLHQVVLKLHNVLYSLIDAISEVECNANHQVDCHEDDFHN